MMGNHQISKFTLIGSDLKFSVFLTLQHLNAQSVKQKVGRLILFSHQTIAKRRAMYNLSGNYTFFKIMLKKGRRGKSLRDRLPIKTRNNFKFCNISTQFLFHTPRDSFNLKIKLFCR